MERVLHIKNKFEMKQQVNSNKIEIIRGGGIKNTDLDETDPFVINDLKKTLVPDGDRLVILLWSGGWDGTFRLLQLAEKDIWIQPVYVIDKERRSTPNEKQAMRSILDKIQENKAFKAQIFDIKYYEVDWILENCKNPVISADFALLRRKYKVGTQYEWFALLCDRLCVQMESAVVHQYHGKVEDAIKAEGHLELIKDDFLDERRQVLPRDNIQTAYHVFGNLILPVINLSKKDEEKIAEAKGWMGIMKLSWFCHSPIDGEPCGLCGPCDDAMNTGMEWRVPLKAQKRHKHRKIFLLLRGARNYLYYRLLKNN